MGEAPQFHREVFEAEFEGWGVGADAVIALFGSDELRIGENGAAIETEGPPFFQGVFLTHQGRRGSFIGGARKDSGDELADIAEEAVVLNFGQPRLPRRRKDQGVELAVSRAPSRS